MRTLAPFLLMAVFAGLQYRLWIADGGVAQTQRLAGEVKAQRLENQRLAARNAALEAEVQDLQSGTEAMEARARADLGMVKNGETFYLIVSK